MSENDPHIHEVTGATDRQRLAAQGPGTKREDDAANQSLADALSVSFGLLKFAMVVLVVVYFASGVFQVNPQEVAVELRFGKMIGESDADKVKAPGWYIGLPRPMGDIVRVPVAAENVTLDGTFMYKMREQERSMTHAQRSQSAGLLPLNPLEDGSLITGDANIVHLEGVEFNYQVDATNPSRVVNYVERVGDMDTARKIVIAAAEQGIIHAVASKTLDEIRSDESALKLLCQQRTQAILDEMETGLTVLPFRFVPQVPKPVHQAYSAVTRAESERLQLIDEAKKDANGILGNVAGPAYESLLSIIDEYELAANKGDQQEMTRLDAVLAEAFDNLRMPVDYGGTQIGGRVAEVINEAISFRTQEVERVKADTTLFTYLLPQYKSTPEIVRTRLRQAAMQEIFTDKSELIFLPTDNLELVTSRNPKIIKDRQQEALKRSKEEAAAEAARDKQNQ